jgi:hypothetical protein
MRVLETYKTLEINVISSLNMLMSFVKENCPKLETQMYLSVGILSIWRRFLIEYVPKFKNLQRLLIYDSSPSIVTMSWR